MGSLLTVNIRTMARSIANPAVALLLVLGCTVPAAPQQQELTNADVARLVSARVPTDVVVQMVTSSPVDFDISLAALAALRNDGVPDVVLQAMVARVRPSETADAVVDSGDDAGGGAQALVGSVAFVYGQDRIEMRRSTPSMGSTSTAASLIVNPFARPNRLLRFAGGHSTLRLAIGKPAFQVELPAYLVPTSSIFLVRLDAHPESRDLTIRSVPLEVPDGVDGDAVMPIDISGVTEEGVGGSTLRTYQVDVVHPLTPGEYALLVRDGLFYTFGIDLPQ
jgi:hypothetical protein